MQRCVDAKMQSLLRNILISPLEGEKKFLSELCELRNFREGYNLKYSCRNCNFDRRFYFLKNINYNSDMLHHDKNNKGRLGILAQREAGFEPSPAFVMLTGVRKRLLPLTKREGSDSVISSDFKSKNSITNENNLPRKELSVLVPQYLSNFPDTVFSRFTSHFSRKRTAFTLAEVLITLGIIGIVAALTLPNIINNYKRKQLEVAFKRSSALIQSALNETANDFGFDSFKDINSTCVDQNELNSCKSNNQEFFNSVSSTFISKFKVIKQAKNIDAAKFEGKVIPVYNFSGKQTLYYSQFYGIQRGGYFLSDGTYITGLLFYYHGAGDCVTLTFDTNGPYKGPNRYGYDIFIYTTGHWGLLCSKNTSQPGGFGVDTNFNGRGCYTYALKDVNPDDSSKGYWKSLK